MYMYIPIYMYMYACDALLSSADSTRSYRELLCKTYSCALLSSAPSAASTRSFRKLVF